MTPEEALRDNKRYAAVWEVLQALRAHDERFDAMVNRIDLTSDARPTRSTSSASAADGGERDEQRRARRWPSANLDAWRDAIYAKIVAKVGTRQYWKDWAKSVADIATRQTTRIKALLNDPNTDVARGVRHASSTACAATSTRASPQADAIDMLAQHLITRPVFNALFEGYAVPRPQPGRPGDGADARRPRRAQRRRREPHAGEVLRVGPDAGRRASTTPRAGSGSSSSSTTPSSPPPSRRPSTSSASSTPRSRSSTSS